MGQSDSHLETTPQPPHLLSQISRPSRSPKPNCFDGLDLSRPLSQAQLEQIFHLYSSGKEVMSRECSCTMLYDLIKSSQNRLFLRIESLRSDLHSSALVHQWIAKQDSIDKYYKCIQTKAGQIYAQLELDVYIDTFLNISSFKAHSQQLFSRMDADAMIHFCNKI